VRRKTPTSQATTISCEWVCSSMDRLGQKFGVPDAGDERLMAVPPEITTEASNSSGASARLGDDGIACVRVSTLCDTNVKTASATIESNASDATQ
jgi:hypothetical protein